MAERRATSTDVARLAGVSRATVSYVLNGNLDQSIPEATRERVRAAAAQLSYTPHAAARALRAGRSNIVLLAVRHIPYGRNLGLLVDRLADQVARQGMSLVVWQPGAGKTLQTTLGHLQPRLALSLFQLEDDERDALRRMGVPHAAAESTSGVSASDELTAAIQVHHLAERGHHVIGHLGTGDADLAAFARPRRQGVRRGCLDLGLPAPREASVPVPPHGTVDDVVAVLRDWRSGPDPVSGVAAYNDYVAAMCLRAAAVLGLRVPDDLAVIGVDDDPLSAFLDPPLTTIRLDMVAMADRLLALGLALADGTPEPPNLPSTFVELVVRGST